MSAVQHSGQTRLHPTYKSRCGSLDCNQHGAAHRPAFSHSGEIQVLNGRAVGTVELALGIVCDCADVVHECIVIVDAEVRMPESTPVDRCTPIQDAHRTDKMPDTYRLRV